MCVYNVCATFVFKSSMEKLPTFDVFCVDISNYNNGKASLFFDVMHRLRATDILYLFALFSYQ